MIIDDEFYEFDKHINDKIINNMIEVKIDRETLPEDNQKVKWQTQDDIDEGAFKEGVYSDFDGLFLYGKVGEDEYNKWDSMYDVHHWEPLKELNGE